MTRVALLGTGLLGSAFADGMLSRRGTELTVWNRTRQDAGGAGGGRTGRRHRDRAGGRR